HFKNARIYAFEPVKESFERLEKAVKGIEQIEIFNNAAGDKNETIEIPIYSEPTIATLKPHEYGMPAIAHEKIKVIRLDEFFTGHHIGKIDILKIDVEGFELQVLRGTGQYLEKVNCIIVEVGYVRCDTKTHFTDMDKFMEDNGFYLFNIYELMPMHNDKGQLCYSNNVYLRHKQ
ncbi:MAG TPA: FkbM family methyltransferase, partial [Mucilaginibacter sp.]